MAFNDIRDWAKLMESQENEKKAWNRACDEANSLAEFHDEAELDDCDVDVVDPSDYALTEKEIAEDDSEEEILDEKIDFTKYQMDPTDDEKRVDEADMREILTRIALALEKPASTANLVGQDEVVLNEEDEDEENKSEDDFDDMMQEALNEADSDSDAASAAEFAELAEQLPDEMPDEAKTAVVDAYQTASDYPLDDKTLDIMLKLSLPEQIEVVKNMIGNPKLSQDAKQNLQDDLEMLEDELKRATEKDALMKRACFIQDKSFSENGISKAEEDEFRGLLDKLDDYQKNVLIGRPLGNGFMRLGDVRVFLNPRWIGKSAFQGSGSDNDENLDPELASIDADMARNGHKYVAGQETKYVQEPLEPGYYTFSYNTSRGVSPTERIKDAKLMRDRLEKQGWIKKYYDEKIKPEIAAGQMERYDGEYGGELADQDVVKFTKLLFSLPKTEKNKLYDEMMADASTDGEREFIDSLFDGKAAYPDFKNLNALAGLGFKQDGMTGGGTEWADKHINLRLLMMCEFLNVDAEDVELMRANLRSEKTVSRNIRKEIRPRMMAEIFEELDDADQKALMGSCGIDGRIPDPNVRTEKKAFDKFVNFALGIVVSRASAADKQQLKGMVQDFVNNSQIRKWKSALGDDANIEFQKLVAKQRDQRDDFTDDDRVRMLQLDLVRHGYSEQDALTTAEQIMASPDPEALAKAKGVSANLANTFLKGRNSTNGVNGSGSIGKR